jgi:hypothetical protein
VTAVNNAGDRAIKQVGDEIKLRVALFLDRHMRELAASQSQ